MTESESELLVVSGLGCFKKLYTLLNGNQDAFRNPILNKMTNTTCGANALNDNLMMINNPFSSVNQLLNIYSLCKEKS